MDPKQFKTELLEILGPDAGLVPCGTDALPPRFLLDMFKMFVERCELMNKAVKRIREQEALLFEAVEMVEEYKKERDSARQEVCELRALKLATTEEEYEPLKKQIALNNCWDGIFEEDPK